MPLPVGLWKAIVSGVETDFNIQTPNPQGLFVGRLGTVNLSGFWDESSQRIAFTFAVGGAVPQNAAFVGYLFRTPVSPAPGQDVVATLAGTFQTTTPTAGDLPQATARRTTFGWLAQITEVQ